MLTTLRATIHSSLNKMIYSLAMKTNEHEQIGYS